MKKREKFILKRQNWTPARTGEWRSSQQNYSPPWILFPGILLRAHHFPAPCQSLLLCSSPNPREPLPLWWRPHLWVLGSEPHLHLGSFPQPSLCQPLAAPTSVSCPWNQWSSAAQGQVTPLKNWTMVYKSEDKRIPVATKAKLTTRRPSTNLERGSNPLSTYPTNRNSEIRACN